jgi:hypothetical protein
MNILNNDKDLTNYLLHPTPNVSFSTLWIQRYSLAKSPTTPTTRKKATASTNPHPNVRMEPHEQKKEGLARNRTGVGGRSDVIRIRSDNRYLMDY